MKNQCKVVKTNDMVTKSGVILSLYAIEIRPVLVHQRNVASGDYRCP